MFAVNKARDSGGAIYARDGFINLKETLGNYFIHNSASEKGGAISCIRCSIYVTCDRSTLPVSTVDTTTLNLEILTAGTTSFFNNTVGGFGGAIYQYDFYSSSRKKNVLSLNGTVIVFANNKVRLNGGGLFLHNSETTLNGMYIHFKDNEAISKGGGLYLSSTDAKLNGVKIEFNGNRAYDGGGI